MGVTAAWHFQRLGYKFLAGAMNVMIPTSVVVGALTIVWPHCRTVASLAVLAVFYGYAQSLVSDSDYLAHSRISFELLAGSPLAPTAH